VSKPRIHISASLAERGQREIWANEAEAAALSGMSMTTFYLHVRKLEKAGFPHKTACNGKRFIPAIKGFCHQHYSGELLVGQQSDRDIERAKENFTIDRPKTR